MKMVFLILASSLLCNTSDWLYDFDQAKQIAKESNKMILLNFSGSDWCGPCINLKKKIFDSEEFSNYATGHLLLVNADFPRLKKNQLSAEQTKQNEALAEKYNQEGSFPYTVLLNAEGKVLKKWTGFPDETPEMFVQEIKSFSNVTN